MIPEKTSAGLLQLDERWRVAAAEYETEPVERFLIVVRETEQANFQIVSGLADETKEGISPAGLRVLRSPQLILVQIVRDEILGREAIRELHLIENDQDAIPDTTCLQNTLAESPPARFVEHSVWLIRKLHRYIPNAPAYRRRTKGVRFPIEARARRSMQPACSAFGAWSYKESHHVSVYGFTSTPVVAPGICE